MTDIATLQQDFTLPCGVTLPNRLIKSAMSENNADADGRPSDRIIRLYETWGAGGAAVLISGNVMIDARALGEPKNVVVEDERYLSKLKDWAIKAQANGSHLWMQINHPGRQAPAFNEDVVSASDVALSIKGVFKKPRALTEDEIWDIIDRFGNTAAIAQKAGFKGVQIHGAHGYLVSQFLSSLTNIRKDQWGGSLENRARFAVEIYKNIRSKVGPSFPIGIKINSADFQRGAFSEEESMEVIDMLAEQGIDMIEVSGGTYERAAMMGKYKTKDSTKRREAFFQDFIVKVRARTKVPLLLTGGFRTRAVMAKAISDDELDFIGMARPFAVYPHLAKEFFQDTRATVDIPEQIRTGITFVDRVGVLDINWYADQMKRIGRGEEPSLDMSPFMVFLRTIKNWKI